MPLGGRRRKSAKRKKRRAHGDRSVHSAGNSERNEDDRISRDESESDFADQPSSPLHYSLPNEETRLRSILDRSPHQAMDAPENGLRELGHLYSEAVGSKHVKAERVPSDSEMVCEVESGYGGNLGDESRTVEVTDADVDVTEPSGRSVVTAGAVDSMNHVQHSSLEPARASETDSGGGVNSNLNDSEVVVVSFTQKERTLEENEEKTHSVDQGNSSLEQAGSREIPSGMEVKLNLDDSEVVASSLTPSGTQAERTLEGNEENNSSSVLSAPPDFPRDSPTRESSEIEAGLNPPPVRATSWKSCCGLFEFLGGANR